MDVKTTFLNGDLKEDVYMKQPEGFVMSGNEHKVDAIAWWIDSGATTHEAWFWNLVQENHITLFNVLYVSKLHKNLISGPVLNKCGYKQVYEFDKYILSKSGVFVGFGYYNNGHVHYKRMLEMSKDDLISAIDENPKKYTTCMLTKITRQPFKSITRKSIILELIHSDLCDFHATPSLGIIHETTAPYTPQQNGVAERKNRALKKMVNFMLSYSGLSEGFWGEAMLMACYLLNMVPNKMNKTTPYKLWYKKQPNLSFLRHFKAYRFYVIEPDDSVSINTIIESRDAIFDENHFSSIPRPKDIIPNSDESQRDDHSNDVPSETLEPRKGCKWIFKMKMKFDGTIYKFKARLVIQGFRQKEGIDYFDTYALVARITTIRLLLALAAIHNLVIHQMDVKTIFLNGDLEEVYMKQPEGFVMPGNEHKVCKLVKSLYGLKQAPKQWHQKFDEVVLSSDFLLNQYDKCVYSKFDDYGKGVIICLYVDDMLIFGTDQNQVDKTKKFLSSKFSMKDMGEADVILGIKIKHENKGIVITQSHYIEKILKKINREDCSSVSTPMDPVEKIKPNTGKHVDKLEYSRAISCLMYAMTSTKPDIAYVVGRLSRFTSNPSRQHWHAITRIFKYLRASKKQTCITGSNIEYEFVALAAVGKEAEWIRNLIHEIPIWLKPIALISIHYDSAATLAKAYSQIYNDCKLVLGVTIILHHVPQSSTPRGNSAKLGGCILRLTPFVFRARRVRGRVQVQVRLYPFLDLFFLLKMAKDTIDIVTPVLTKKELDAYCVKYNIHANLRPELPGRDDTIKNSPEGKVVIAAVKVSHFEIMCRVHGGRPTVGTFQMGLLDFVKSFGPFKVKVRERTLGEGEVSLSNETEDMVISPSHNVIRIFEHTVVDELKGVIGKKKKRVAFNNGLSSEKKVRGSSSIASSERNPATACKTPTAIQNLVTQSG
ncbi:zinc finger, CCHC-type containing protein [Tanacetum coccineum]